MNSQHFYRLETPFVAARPTQRPLRTRSSDHFLFDGQHISCNVNILEESGDVIHIQSDHDEVVQVLEASAGSGSARRPGESRPVI